MGLLKEENDSAIIIQTANEKLVVERSEIASRTLSDTSMMPEGQLDSLTLEQIRDLVAYLASPSQVALPNSGPTLGSDGTVHNAIEGESLKVLRSTDGSTTKQPMATFKESRWSGDEQLWWTGGKVGSELTVAIPAPAAGSYEIYAALTKANDYATVSLAINGHLVSQSLDCYAPNVVSTGSVSLGTHELKQGTNELQIKIIGSNPKAHKSYMFGIDYVFLKN